MHLRFLPQKTELLLTAGLFLASANPIAAAQTSECGPAWQPVGNPGARCDHGGAFDTRRGVFVVFGGTDTSNSKPAYGDTWEYDGNSWHRVATTGPNPRTDVAMTYDRARGVCVMFGGVSGNYSTAYHDTWEWDGLIWRQVATTGPTSGGYDMTFDEARGISVLFGGGSDASIWEWDGTTWIQKSPSSPHGSYYAKLAYDSDHHDTIVYGGQSNIWTWEWDGQQWFDPNQSQPGPRTEHGLVFDPIRHNTVLFGWTGSDTWTWDGSTWTLANNTGPGPARQAFPMVFDSVHGRTMLYGGVVGSSGPLLASNDLWGWDGTSWTQVTSLPTGRKGTALAFDRARNRVVLFGGDIGTTKFHDTWEWDGANWLLRNDGTDPNRPSPVVQTGAKLVYDEQRGVCVLFGGSPNGTGTWEWNGSAWNQASAQAPSATAGIYDATIARVVALTTTTRYEWNGVSWSSAALSQTISATGGWSYDRNAGRIITYNQSNGDTWSVVGTTATKISTGPVLTYGQMTFDEAAGVPILIGGTSAFPYQVSVWDFGRSWQLRTTSFSPAYRGGYATVFDSVHGVSLYFGGYYSPRYFNDFQQYASSNLPGDVSGDGIVDLSDLVLLLANFGMSADVHYYDGDANRDGIVDLSDLSLLLSLYGSHCP